MIKLRVLSEHFVIGTRHVAKGDIIEVNPAAVNYCVNNKSCELVKSEPVVSKPKSRKKASYKTRDVKAED